MLFAVSRLHVSCRQAASGTNRPDPTGRLRYNHQDVYGHMLAVLDPRPDNDSSPGRTARVLPDQRRSLPRPFPTDLAPADRFRAGALAGVLSLALAIAAGTPLAATLAQDGTGAALPTDCEVVPSAIDLATWQSPEEILAAQAAEATPEPTSEPAADASPVASPVSDGATPIASPIAASAEEDPAETPEPTPGPDPLAGELEQIAASITECLNEQNTTTFVSITSDEYRGQLVGFPGPLSAEDWAQLAPTFPDTEYEIVELTGVDAVDESTATATVTYRVANQLRTGIWTFAQAEIDGMTAWRLDAEEARETAVPDGATEIEITIAGNAYDLSNDEPETDAVAFSITNEDEEDHEALVLRYESGVESGDLLQAAGPSLPDGVTLVGQVTVPAGEQGGLVLVDLPAGTYHIVCLLPNAEGIPHLADGMEATFTVD